MKEYGNWTKPTDNPDDYASNFEWTKTASKYHFDDTIEDKEGEWFQVLGRFGESTLWEEETKRLIEVANPVNWETRKFYGDKPGISPMLAQEEYDIVQGGGNPKHHLASMLDDFDEFPYLYKMCDYFGLTSEPGNEVQRKYRAHVQLTGQMFNRHIDKLWEWSHNEPTSICRVGIFLEDWQPGQFYMYGNYLYKNWKAGEAHIFDWANVPHCTANASNVPRASLLITGVMTDKTREILANASRDRIFKLR